MPAEVMPVLFAPQMRWILETQVSLLKAIEGADVTIRDFGYPADEDASGAYFGGGAQPASSAMAALPPGEVHDDMKNAHEEAMAGARAARQRNAGSLTFG